MFTTAIKDHLDAVDLEHPARRIQPMSQKRLFSKLTCKLKVKIKKSLACLRQGCVEVTGRIVFTASTNTLAS